MTSVYTSRHLDKLKDLGFKHIKVGSAQAGDEELIHEILGRGFNLIVSLGGRTKYPGWLFNADWHFYDSSDGVTLYNPPFAVMHCISKYPHDHTEANLCKMMELKKLLRGDILVGYSDHSPSTYSAKAAMYFGADLVEKHVTVLAKDKTKDGPVSITMSELEDLVEFGKLASTNQWEMHKELGIWKAPTDQQSVELIKEYAERWKR